MRHPLPNVDLGHSRSSHALSSAETPADNNTIFFSGRVAVMLRQRRPGGFLRPYHLLLFAAFASNSRSGQVADTTPRECADEDRHFNGKCRRPFEPDAIRLEFHVQTSTAELPEGPISLHQLDELDPSDLQLQEGDALIVTAVGAEYMNASASSNEYQMWLTNECPEEMAVHAGTCV